VTIELPKNILANKICPWLMDPLTQFEKSKQEDRLAHGWLIAGQQGLGKLNLALIMANRLVNPSTDWPQILDSKEAETAMALRHEPHNHHPDLHWIRPEEGKRRLSVDYIKGNKQKNITGISQTLHLTSHDGNAKVAVIEAADTMTKEAANALLKTLEEPSQNTYLFLVAHQPGRLPSTIRSRCQFLSVQGPGHEDGLAWLGSFDQTVSHSDWSILLDLTDRSPLQALRLYTEGFLSKNKEYLGFLDKVSKNELDPQKVADTWIKEDLDLALTWLTRQLRKVIHLRLSNRSLETDKTADYRILTTLMNTVSTKKLFQLHDKSEYLLRSLGGGVNSELALKALLLEFQASTEA
jgi:DNA polymerase III subunit delta'